MIELNVWAAWIGIAFGLLSGTIQGLFFASEDWLGGYGSWPRRMLRLGHISFFGIAFLNLAYANTLHLLGGERPTLAPSILLIAGAVLMPAVCYLAASSTLAKVDPLSVMKTDPPIARANSVA